MSAMGRKQTLAAANHPLPQNAKAAGEQYRSNGNVKGLEVRSVESLKEVEVSTDYRDNR